jgi:hypothetical protein
MTNVKLTTKYNVKISININLYASSSNPNVFDKLNVFNKLNYIQNLKVCNFQCNDKYVVFFIYMTKSKNKLYKW